MKRSDDASVVELYSVSSRGCWTARPSGWRPLVSPFNVMIERDDLADLSKVPLCVEFERDIPDRSDTEPSDFTLTSHEVVRSPTWSQTLHTVRVAEVSGEAQVQMIDGSSFRGVLTKFGRDVGGSDLSTELISIDLGQLGTGVDVRAIRVVSSARQSVSDWGLPETLRSYWTSVNTQCELSSVASRSGLPTGQFVVRSARLIDQADWLESVRVDFQPSSLVDDLEGLNLMNTGIFGAGDGLVVAGSCGVGLPLVADEGSSEVPWEPTDWYLGDCIIHTYVIVPDGPTRIFHDMYESVRGYDEERILYSQAVLIRCDPNPVYVMKTVILPPL